MRTFLCALALALPLWARPTSGAPLRAVDGRGIPITLKSAPKRIVSLIPSTTEIVYALGLGPNVVGVTTYCDYPPRARSVAKIGDYNTSIEKVLALHPDLVVASSSGNRTAVARLEQLKVPVFAMDPVTIEQVYQGARSLGDLTGRRKEADAMVAGMQKKMADVARRVAGRPRERTLLVLGMNPLWVVGGRNFMNTLVECAGGENVAKPGHQGFCQIALESVVAARPSVILSAGDRPEAFKTLGAWRTIPAVRANRVYATGYDTVRPGPRLADAAERLARMLHPEAFQQ